MQLFWGLLFFSIIIVSNHKLEIGKAWERGYVNSMFIYSQCHLCCQRQSVDQILSAIAHDFDNQLGIDSTSEWLLGKPKYNYAIHECY